MEETYFSNIFCSKRKLVSLTRYQGTEGWILGMGVGGKSVIGQKFTEVGILGTSGRVCNFFIVFFCKIIEFRE